MRDLFNHRVDLEERVLKPDEFMGQVAVWVAVKKNLRCRLEPLSEREKSLFHREGATITHRLFFKPIKRAIDEHVSRIVRGKRVFRLVGSRDEDEQGKLMVLHLIEAFTPEERDG